MSISENKNNIYQAFGLNVLSFIPLPELLPGDNGEPDVIINLGLIPETLEDVREKGVRYQINPRQFLLQADNVAKFLVSDGREIIVERAPGASDSAVNLFLLGSAMGALLHQRGLLPLHGSAVEINGSGVVFVGPSGHGKSTLAAALVGRGYPLLSDDICVLSFAKGDVPLLVPAYPQMKLWADMAKKMGYNPKSLRRVRPELEKHGIPVGKIFSNCPVSPRRIYLLSVSNTPGFELTPVKGMEKIEILIENTYRVHLLEGMNGRRPLFKRCIALANQVEIRRLARPETGFWLDELTDILEKDLD